MSQVTQVVKLGGSLLSQPKQLTALFAELATGNPGTVIVHGGGSTVDHWLAHFDYPVEKLDGLRVSPNEQMPVIIGALAGYANKQLQSLAIAQGLSAAGLSLWEAGIHCRALAERLGQVGACTPGSQDSLLPTLIEQRWLPIISCIGFDAEGHWYNVNADDAAAAIAAEHDAELLFITDVAAVLDQYQQPIPTLTAQDFVRYCDEGLLRDGMKVKVASALQAAEQLRRAVRIGGCECLTRPELGTEIRY